MHYLCHYCNKSTFHQFYVKCCKKKCSKLFCLDCILQKFDKDFKPENVRRETWICYACGQKCDCMYCDPKGLKRSGCSSSQTSLKLRVSGKFKWYHEKNRGALKTISYDCLKPMDVKMDIKNIEKSDEKESCGSVEKEVKLEKRKQKHDLSNIENKYLNKKKALRECSEQSEQEIMQELGESKHEKIAKLLSSIDLEGTEVEILDAENEIGLLDYFKKYNGLLSLQNKIPIKDNYSLSLVYTPGVGQSCMEIQKNPETAFIYTNKGNSMLVITDSSGYPDFDPLNWHNNYAIPNVEAISVYYKSMVNVDAYPMVFDYRTTHTAEEVYETVRNVMPAYSALELYNINEDRLQKIMPMLQKLEGQFVIITTFTKNYIKSKIQALSKCKLLNDLFVISCIIRAALDTRSFVIIPNGLIDEMMKMIESTECATFGHSPFIFANNMISVCTEYFIKNKLNLNMAETVESVSEKFHRFLIEGPTSWFEPVQPSFKSAQASLNENSLILHKRLSGMIESSPKILVKDPGALNQLFREEEFKKIQDYIRHCPDIATKITCKRNFSAIITNGTAVLGFGNIGSLAGLPVMEGKSCLFKQLGGVDLVPICILETKPEKVREIVERIHPIYNAINLEDIKAPECFEIEKPLEEKLDIPIFHDDQHGTAIVVVAAVLNSLKLLKKKAEEVKVVVNGGGAAGLSITQLLLKIGIKDLIICDTTGAIFKGRKVNMNKNKDELAEITNPKLVAGPLIEVIKGANFFIGVSAGKILNKEMVQSMAHQPVIFALANPVPEILPHEAKEGGAFIVATGRSDFKNQVNNSLAFPGLFRALLDVRARYVTLEMKMAAAEAIANLVKGDALTTDHIISNALDAKVPIAVSKAVAQVAIKQKVAREMIDPDFVEENTRQYLVGGNLMSNNSCAECKWN